MAERIEFKGLLSFLILHELRTEALYGEQLAARVGARKGDTLTPGTIYPALKRLRECKLVTYSRDGRKKVYSLSATGKKELAGLYKEFGRYFKGLREKIPKVRKKSTTARKRAVRARSRSSAKVKSRRGTRKRTPRAKRR